MEQLFSYTNEYEEFATEVINTTNWAQTKELDIPINKMEAKLKEMKKEMNAKLESSEFNKANFQDLRIEERTILVRSLARITEDDAKNSYEAIKDILRMIPSHIFKVIISHYKSNQVYDALSVLKQLIQSIREKYKQFCIRFDKNGVFLGYLRKVTMSMISFAEDFKTYWLEFLTTEFYDYVDVGILDKVLFNQLVLAKSKRHILQYQLLEGVLFNSLNVDIWKTINNFCSIVGTNVMRYHQTIRMGTRKKLQTLNSKLNETKFLTTHVVICAVYRLRFELKQMNELNFKKISFLWNVDRSVLKDFWSQSVRHFDKDFENMHRKPQFVSFDFTLKIIPNINFPLFFVCF